VNIQIGDLHLKYNDFLTIVLLFKIF